MRATFSGFEAIRKALMASQINLDVTSQNVSNVNTKGYTRQRADVTSISPDTTASKYAVTNAGLVGQGVEVTGISQTRDQFLDARYRKNNAESGKWSTSLAIMTDIETVIDETTTDGLSASLTDFYNELQNFSSNAETVEYASTFRAAAKKVVEIFNQYSNQLSDVKEEQIFDCSSDVDTVNRSLERIAQLNSEIKSDLVRGTTPNELLDSRNLLLDDLSGLLGVSIEAQTDGQVSIKLGDEYLLDSQKSNYLNELVLDSSGGYVEITLEDGSAASITSGAISGYLNGINGKGIFAADSENSTNGIAYFQESINALAKAFGDNFNKINDSTGINKLFIGDSDGKITAANIQLSQDWLANAEFITRSTNPSGTTDTTEGENGNLLLMLQSMDAKQSVTPYFSGTFEEFSVSVIGDAATNVEYAKDMSVSARVDLKSIANQRESISGVSTDEESVNMIKYQKSYDAAARIMTVLDEMLDTIINDIGVVGQ